MPAADRLPAELDHQFDYLYRWLDHTERRRRAGSAGHHRSDAARRDPSDQRDPAGGLLRRDHAMVAWLSLEALRIWVEHGPARTLLGPASHAAFAAVALRGDYAAGYRAMRRILALGEARGYEPDTSQARFLFALLGCWFEPIENGVQAARRAREGLIAGGDLANAGYTYYTAVQWPAGLRAIAGRLRRRGGGGAGLRAAYRQRADRPVARRATGGWPVCCAAKAPPQPVRRSRPTGTPTTRWRCSTRISPARSPPPSSAIWPA